MKRAVLFSIVLAGCGDNRSPCDYTEHDDVDNDTTGETTGLSIGAQPESFCGAIQGGHFANGVIDTDRFRVSVAGSDILFQLTGDDGVSVLPNGIEVRIFNANPNPTLIAAGSYDGKLADHTAFTAVLPAGDYDIAVSARAGGDLSGGDVTYRVRVSPDDSQSCQVTRAADYTEAHDGGGSTGNDVVAVSYAASPQFTSMAGTPEPSGLAFTANDSFRISGTAGTDAQPDDYLDRDTFEVDTDDTANELTVRLDWTGDTADLDYILFDDAALTAVATSNTASTMAPEVSTFAVKPSTKYRLWIGRHAGAASSPVTYDASVCGNHFF